MKNDQNVNNLIDSEFSIHQEKIKKIIPDFSINKLKKYELSTNSYYIYINGFNIDFMVSKKQDTYNKETSNFKTILEMKTRIYDYDIYDIEPIKKTFSGEFFEDNFKTLLEIKSNIENDLNSRMNLGFSLDITANKVRSSIKYNIVCSNFSIRLNTTDRILNSISIIDFHKKFKNINIYIHKEVELKNIFSKILKIYLKDINFNNFPESISSDDFYDFISLNQDKFNILKEMIAY